MIKSSDPDPTFYLSLLSGSQHGDISDLSEEVCNNHVMKNLFYENPNPSQLHILLVSHMIDELSRRTWRKQRLGRPQRQIAVSSSSFLPALFVVHP